MIFWMPHEDLPTIEKVGRYVERFGHLSIQLNGLCFFVNHDYTIIDISILLFRLQPFLILGEIPLKKPA